jgi:hypothetical protein
MNDKIIKRVLNHIATKLTSIANSILPSLVIKATDIKLRSDAGLERIDELRGE